MNDLIIVIMLIWSHYQSDEHPNCLNVKRLWYTDLNGEAAILNSHRDGVVGDAPAVGDRVRRAMLKTADKYISAEGVNYQGIAKCKSFKKYINLTLELQQVRVYFERLYSS